MTEMHQCQQPSTWKHYPFTHAYIPDIRSSKLSWKCFRHVRPPHVRLRRSRLRTAKTHQPDLAPTSDGTVKRDHVSRERSNRGRHAESDLRTIEDDTAIDNKTKDEHILSNAQKLKATSPKKRRSSSTGSKDKDSSGLPKPPDFYSPTASPSAGSKKSARRNSHGVQLANQELRTAELGGARKPAKGDCMDVNPIQSAVPPGLGRPGTPVPGAKPSPEERYVSDSITIPSSVPRGADSRPEVFYSEREHGSSQKDFAKHQTVIQMFREEHNQPTWMRDTY